MKKLKKNTLNAINYLEQNPTVSITQAGNLYSTDRHQIVKYLKDDEYKQYVYESPTDLNYMYAFSEEEMAAIDNYEECLKKGFPAFQKKYPGAPATKATLIRWLKILGKDPQIKEKNSYHFNRNAFSEIVNEEDAYWLGFITADGCLVNDDRLSINLAEKDKEHLKNFCRYLGMPEIEISSIIKSSFGGAYDKNNPVSCLNICSVQIVKNLKNKGITARKSGKEVPYICSSIELEKDYIRGLIDGDGYIRQTSAGLGIVGSYEICEYVQNFISNNIIDISSNHIREHGIIYKLELTGRNQSQIILDYLYKNAKFYLTRKFNIYQENYCRG